MLDFVTIKNRPDKKGRMEVYPEFCVVKKTTDLMTRGGAFYAIWDEEIGLWSKNEFDVVELVDKEVQKKKDELEACGVENVKCILLSNFSTRKWSEWKSFVKSRPDSYVPLDTTVTFSDAVTTKQTYASKKLPYPLKKMDIPAYKELTSTLYNSKELAKLEWAIGAILLGKAKDIQKFIVIYGSAGAGKSTMLNIIQQLFYGYYSVFEAKALASNNNSFALEAFTSNPLVAIQHDGDLSHIEDNTKLNSIVSHEQMVVNEKFKNTYNMKFDSFLFMGTNKPVKITDAKSGIIRRLIDVRPSGRLVPHNRYDELMNQIKFELGGIAQHCMDVYKKMGASAYDSYKPVTMIGETNDFFNFVEEQYDDFKNQKYVTLKHAWAAYKQWCENANISYPMNMRVMRMELANYFDEYRDRYVDLDDGKRVRSVFIGFRADKFDYPDGAPVSEQTIDIWAPPDWLNLSEQQSKLDDILKSCPAQYATDDGTPTLKWADVLTELQDIDTSKQHYVKPPQNLIVIDFDIKDSEGNKSMTENLKVASQWPRTYTELSKSGAGVHLHYIYDGDVSKLSRIYDDDIEIKVFTGNMALRRRLTRCNDLDISTINSGLPLKGEKNMVEFKAVQSEKALRTMIKKNLNKEYHANTAPSIDFIAKILNDAYECGLHYDVSDMRQAIQTFALNSTHQAQKCVKTVQGMKFKSEEHSEQVEAYEDSKIVFFDVEVFPNLFIICWKYDGVEGPCVRMINPEPADVEEFMKHKLVGFNCRKYDNHIVYARMMGYDNMRLFELSQNMVNNHQGFFGEAYNVSYTDILDFSSKKQSLKKFEIELGIHHQELGLPWDQPVPEEKWQLVAEYCDNDVFATEATFHARAEDFEVRQILADLSGLTVNDSTRSHATKIMFGNNKAPQTEFNYRDLSKPVGADRYSEMCERMDRTDFRVFNEKGEPTFEAYHQGQILPDGYSILPFFPGYKFGYGKSMYKGVTTGEGGYVYSETHSIPSPGGKKPKVLKGGAYGNVALLDIASMHPSSIEAECLFGPMYTKRFSEIKQARIAAKHHDFEASRDLLGGVLTKYLTSDEEADKLASALKIVINSVYGYTSATFTNPFKDPRNMDNIVAKRGALFMVNLVEAVKAKGFTVAHIKTDSIKIPDATDEIIQFVMDYGKEYGYSFEHEATYDKLCLVNDAVYIARYDDMGIRNKGGKHAGEWTATGTQFQVPYVFKTLFSKEPITFDDMCETKTVQTALYLDFNDNLPEGEHDYHFVGKAGLFCPILPGKGGGELVRDGGNGKFVSATGAKGYRWLESEMVKNLHKEHDIDKTYYRDLCNTAIETISEFTDFEWLIDEAPYNGAVPFMDYMTK
jgi:phage/plasmid-associated DNA primase